LLVTAKQQNLERRNFLICRFTTRRHISKMITNFLHMTALLTWYKLWPFTREYNFITQSLYGVVHPWLNAKGWMCVMDHVVFSLTLQGYTLWRFILTYFALSSSSSYVQGQASWPSPVSIFQCRRLVIRRPEFLFPAGWHFVIICGLSVLRTRRDSVITTSIWSSAKKKGGITLCNKTTNARI